MKKHEICILAAGTLWGLMGIFVRALAGFGIGSEGTLTIRCGLAAVMFGITILIRNKHLFRIKLKDLWCFFGSGIMSLLFFTYCYFKSMDVIGIGMSAVLLYTAPSIVIILSRIIFRERLTVCKIIAVIMAFAGCCCVSGTGAGGKMPLSGLLVGLGAGFGYALYSIFARLAMDRGYNGLTVNFYSCLLAAAGGALIWDPAPAMSAMTSSAGCLALCAAAAALSCYLPYLLYTYGLTGTETGKASVMASVEMVVAALVGIIVFREKLTAAGVCGMVLVLGAIVLLNAKPKKNAAKK